MQSAVLVQNVSMSDIEATLSRLLDEKLSNMQPANNQEPVKYLTRKETAAKLRISLPTLADWTRTGILKSKRIGSRILYLSTDVEAAIKDRRLWYEEKILQPLKKKASSTKSAPTHVQFFHAGR